MDQWGEETCRWDLREAVSEDLSVGIDAAGIDGQFLGVEVPCIHGGLSGGRSEFRWAAGEAFASASLACAFESFSLRFKSRRR